MNIERGELAEIISEHIDDWPGNIADAILDAGYRKPRTVTTAKELDALPHGSIVRIGSLPAFSVKREDGLNWWLRIGTDLTIDSAQLASTYSLPATVLHVGGDHE